MRKAMKRFAVSISYLAVALLGQTTGSMSGVLKDTSGTPISGAIVAAYLQAKSTDGKFPPVFNVKTGSDGSFVFSALPAGTYVLCAENADVSLLDPCFWSGKTTSATVPTGGSATGVSLIAEKGVALRIRLNDPQGLLSSNPNVDDILIGAKPATGPPLPTQLASKDATGKMMTLFVPPAKDIDILVYSRNLLLADAKGNPFTTPNFKIKVTAPSAGAAQGSPPDLILNIKGQAAKP